MGAPIVAQGIPRHRRTWDSLPDGTKPLTSVRTYAALLSRSRAGNAPCGPIRMSCRLHGRHVSPRSRRSRSTIRYATRHRALLRMRPGVWPSTSVPLPSSRSALDQTSRECLSRGAVLDAQDFCGLLTRNSSTFGPRSILLRDGQILFLRRTGEFPGGCHPLRVDSPSCVFVKPGVLAACLAPHQYLSGAALSPA